jgi:hypothetical protein
MTAGVRTAHLDEIGTLRFESDAEPDWKPIRHHLGIGAFGVNAWLAADVGDQVIERHDEAPDEHGTNGHEELYVVFRGAARFTVADDVIDAPAGTLVFIEDPALVREAVATEPGTVVFVVGAARGVAFEPSDWETGWLEKMARSQPRVEG